MDILTEVMNLPGIMTVLWKLTFSMLEMGLGQPAPGGLYRETDRIDVWGRGDSSGNYDHYYYNGPDDYGKAPDGRHGK